MDSAFQSALKLDLPDGRGVSFPPPVLPLDEYIDWLEERHQERVRRGDYYERYLNDPYRWPVDAPFRLD